jgi:glycosyltransferase involved in cell wall biosynthesis
VKVLVVSHLYPTPDAGRALFVHQQCLALKGLGLEVRVIAPTPHAPRFLWSNERLRRRGQTPTRAVLDGIGVDYPRFVQPPRRILFDRLGDLAYRSVRRLPVLRQTDFDIIQAHQALPNGALAARLAQDLGVPYVVTVHGADVNQWLPAGGAIGARAAAVLREAGAVVAVSGVVARRLGAYVPLDNVHVVQNGGPGASPPAEPADYLPGRPLVLCAARLIPGKGLEPVVRALAALPGDVGEAHCAIAGDGPLRRPLEALAAELGLQDRVHFLGWLGHDRLLAMMARADVFALPSAPEGFGLVHLEAMSQGTPVVACRDEGPADFIEDGVSGLLVADGDLTGLAGALRSLLADPGRAAAIGEAGRAVAASYTWERNARRMRDLYEEVVAGAPRKD